MNADRRPQWRSRTRPLPAVVLTIAALMLVTAGAEGTAAVVVPPLVAATAVTVAVWAVFRRRRERADYEQQLTAWAAAEAVLAERLRIAHDLHDVVSHGLGLITVRAAATRHLAKPPEVHAALADIERASRGATAELRRMLSVLREPAAGAPRAPAEGLDALPGIVRAAGVRADLTVGPLGEVAPSVQMAVCQVVREGLDNTARHAGPADVRVTVRGDGASVVVSVADGGPTEPGWQAVPGAGHGLLGLRERVAAVGGALSAERVDGGFRLTARLPRKARA